MALRTYLDTGVLIAAHHGEPQISEAAMEIIADPQREFIITCYLKLELLPKAVFHKQQSEEEFYETFFHACEYVPSTDQLSSDALELAKRYGLGGMDALHIAAAINAGAKEFITKERPTTPMFRVPEAEITVKTIHL